MDAVRHGDRIFLDTSPVNYFLEGHPKYIHPMGAFFRSSREVNATLVTSPVTLAECLVHPIKNELPKVAEEYKRLLLTGAGVEFHSIGKEAAEHAANLRASHVITMADALQIGVVLASHCNRFLTNDKRLSRITDIEVLLVASE